MPESFDVSRESVSRSTHFYRKVQEKLGTSGVRSDKDLAGLVEKRLPASTVKALVRGGLSDNEIFRLVIPRRTLAHRIARREPLSRDESDRAVRLARTAALAEQVFANSDRSWQWMRQAKRRFAGRSPLELLETEAGARLVEELLYQIDDGMVA